MRQIKSERLKKMEQELQDLEQWLKLGLVPKKDIARHKDEIASIKEKIEEEKERLQFLKESGEVEEYVTPKKSQTRSGYTEMPSIPDIDIAETATAGISGSTVSEDTEVESESTVSEDKEEEAGTTTDLEEDESYFSDRARWRRGGILDPESNDW